MGPAPERRLYLPEIDGLRFVACALVFIHHAPMPNNVVKALGWSGVDLFFVISSFLFTTLLHEEQKRTRGIDVGAFYVRRILRIAPLYYCFLAAMLVLFATDAFWTRSNIVRAVGAVTFTDNLISAFRGGWSQIPYALHLWTISFEMQVYAAIPFVFVFFSRLSMRAILMTCAAAVGVSVIARYWAIQGGVTHPTIWMVPVLRIEPVLMGFVVAFVCARGFLPAWKAWFRVAAAAGLSALLFTYATDRGVGDYGPWQLYLPASTAAVMGLLVVEAVSRNSGLLASAAMRYLGKISYGIYVFHIIGISAAVWLLGAPSDIPEGAACFVMAATLTISAAALSYRLLERPFLRMKTRYEIVLSRPV